MAQLIYRWFLRTFTLVIYGLLRIACLIPQRRSTEAPLDILLTGTFYTEQWLATHLVPLARSSRVNRVLMVASRPVPQIEGVEGAYPPAWLDNL